MKSTVDKNQINQIYSKYSSMMYSIAFSILKNHSDSEDVVQTVFIKLIEKNLLKNIEDDKIKAFLSIVAKHQALDFYRTRNRRDFANISDEIIVESSDNSLYDAINALPQDLKEVLILKYYVGYSSREIAVALGLRWNTVQKKITTAKRIIKKELSND